MESTPATDIHNETIFEVVPATVGRVLEIGTGSGALARALLRRSPGIEYIGVEIEERHAELSRRYCTRVYVDNFEHPGYQVLNEVRQAECIIFSDVLEHFVDPWNVLRMLHATMAERACLVASIPNLQHWSVQLRVHRGDFIYGESSLLDRTHLRFFTRRTILELFNSTGFQVHTIQPRIFDFPNQVEGLQWIAATARLLEIDESQATQDAAAFQYVVVATPRPPA
jgi:2-polyprenyl-3-methyl-5-hydroxy-6-metoxy-1,4-benzoquinol methylase